MKLFEATNGWLGNSYVRALVIAATEEDALAAAKTAFKKAAGSRYAPSYWEKIELEELASDTALPWVGEVSDG